MSTMRAMTIRAYGAPDVLHEEEVPKPSPGPRDLLVRVRAVSVNPVDWRDAPRAQQDRPQGE